MWLLTLALATMAGAVALQSGQEVRLADFDETQVADLFERLQNASSGPLDALAITNCSLRELNVSLAGLEELRRLNLSTNRFAEIDHALGALTQAANLSHLDLSANQLTTVNAEAFVAFSGLLWLRLRSNRIAKVDERGFEGLNSLEDLNLGDNRLDTLPSGALVPLDSLQKLDLSGNKLQVLGASWFETLTRLRELDVSRNGLSKAASGVLQPLPGLSVLRLAENPLRERDVSLLLGTGRRLETVDASRTGLVRVPAALTRSVRALRLAGNKLKAIRCGDLDSYPLLRLLDLSNNRLSMVEEDALGRLEVLEELDISGNVLIGVPRSLPSSLTSLDLARNYIGAVRFNDLQGLYNLRNLSLDGNVITVIEEGSFSQLPALRLLDISYNPIKTITANTLNGPNDLAFLRMSGLNQLQNQHQGDMAFPVPAPEKLVLLDVSRSPILAAQFLTDDAALSACRSLQILDIGNANVSSIRMDLTYVMPQLRILALSGNDWNCTSDQLWLSDWLRQHLEPMPRVRCSAPDQLAGKYLADLVAIMRPPSTSLPADSVTSSTGVTSTTPVSPQPLTPTSTQFTTSTSLHTTTSTSFQPATSTSSQFTTTKLPPSTTSFQKTTPTPTQPILIISTLGQSKTTSVTTSATSTSRVSSEPKDSESSAVLTFKRVFLSEPSKARAVPNSIGNTVAQELNSKVTDPGARLAPEPLVGPHPGMLVLAGAALGVAAVLTAVLSRRAARRGSDAYHRHENIEVHSLTPTTELW